VTYVLNRMWALIAAWTLFSSQLLNYARLEAGEFRFTEREANWGQVNRLKRHQNHGAEKRVVSCQELNRTELRKDMKGQRRDC
jgi:hypothetical protein